MELERPRRPLLTYGTYPALLLVTVVALAAAVLQDLDRNAIIGGLTGLTIVVLLTVERLNPLAKQWAMTTQSLLQRDLPFIGLAVVVEQIATVGVGLVVVSTLQDDGFGPLGRLPLIGQAIFALVALDLLWYGYHRMAHTVSRLWRVHGLHHSPSEVYVLVHQVFHPIDLLVSRFVIAVVVFKLTGISADAAFVVIALLGLQQTISHVNSDLRLGWANYVVVGPETHRYHHGAGERGNYSSVVMVWDLLFRTFVYHPDRVPDRLGLDDPSSFPDPKGFHAALVWPLRPGKEVTAALT